MLRQRDELLSLTVLLAILLGRFGLLVLFGTHRCKAHDRKWGTWLVLRLD